MLVPSWFTVWPRVCEGVILSVNKEYNDHLMEGLFIPVVWLLFGGGSPLCWDLPAPMSWLPWSRRSRRWLLSECKKISFQRHWWSCARVDMIRPGIQGSSHNIDPSDSTVLQENAILANTRASTTSKTSTRTTRKTKPNLLHYTGPLQHHLHRATKDCCSLTLGLCPDSWSWFVFWSPFLAAL